MSDSPENSIDSLSSDRDMQIASIVAEYQSLLESGKNPDRQLFLTKHRVFEDELTACFDAVEFVQRLAPALHSAPCQKTTEAVKCVESSHGEFGTSNAMELVEQQIASRTKIGSGPFPHIGNYKMIREIGRGGMGIVFEAEHTELGRHIAIKVLAPHLMGDSDAVRRFRREAKAAGKLQHPNIVPIHEVSKEDEASLYFTMPLIHGVGLDQVIAMLKGKGASGLGMDCSVDTVSSTGGSSRSGSDHSSQLSVSVREFMESRASMERAMSISPEYFRFIAKIGQQVAQALSCAHERSILHRDIKPSNILLDTSGTAWVSDFGLAKDLDEKATLSTDLAGTLRYMAPERFSGVVDVRSDIYGLGLVMYELATLQPAFDHTDRASVIDAIRSNPLSEARQIEPRMPRDLNTIIAKATAFEPGSRYDSAAEMADDLHRFLAHLPIRARVVGPWERLRKWVKRHPSLSAMMIVVVLAAIGTTMLWLRAESSWIREQIARERAEHFVYNRDIAVADFEYRSHNIERSRQILENCNPNYRNWEWEYLSQRVHRSVWHSPVLSHSVSAVAISKNGRFVAAGFGSWNTNVDQKIEVWDTQDNRSVCVLNGLPPCHITELEFSPDGSSVLGSAIVWEDLVDGQSPIGGAFVWDLPSGDLRLKFNERDSHIARYTLDGNSILVGDVNGVIKQYSALDGKVLREFRGSSGFISELDFSPDESLFTAVAKNGTLCIWELASGKRLHRRTELGDLRAVSWSTDGEKLVVMTYDGIVRTFDVRGVGLELHELHTERELLSFKFSPDGTHFVKYSRGSGIEIRDAKRLGLEMTLQAHGGHTRDIKFDGTGRTLVSGGLDHVVHVWDLSRHDPNKRTTNLNSAKPAALVYSPDGSEIAVAMTHRKTKNVSISGEPRIEIRNSETMQVAQEFIGHTDWPTCVAYRTDGKQLISGALDTTVRTWDARTGEQIYRLEHHSEAVTGVAFCSDKQLAVSSDQAGRICVWKLADGTVHRSWEVGEKIVAISIFPDRSLVAIAKLSGEISIWDLYRGACIGRSKGGDTIVSMCMSNDGQRIATGHENSSIRIWQSKELLEKPLAGCTSEMHGHTDAVTSMQFSPDGKRLISGSVDESFRLFDVDLGQELLCIDSQMGVTNHVLFSPNGRDVLRQYGNAISTWSISAKEVPSETERSSVEWHLSQAKWAEGHQLFGAAVIHYSELMRLESDPQKHTRSRATARLFSGHWLEAKSDFLALEKLSTFDQFYLARAQLMLGDIEGYSARCKMIQGQTLKSKNIGVLNSFLWTCALSNHVPDDCALAMKEFERTFLATKNPKPYLYIAMSLGCYRESRFRDAILHAKRSIELEREKVNPNTWLIIAMSIARLKQGERDRSQSSGDLLAGMQLEEPEAYVTKVKRWIVKQKQRMFIGERPEHLAIARMNMDIPIFLRELAQLGIETEADGGKSRD